MRTPLAELAWTLMRVAFGAVMALEHGYGKVFGGKAAGLAAGLASSGWPFPHFFAWCAGLTEFFGGLLVAAGLATRGAASLVCFVMLVALWSGRHGGLADVELALLYFAVMLNFALQGSGRYGLDGWLKLRLPVGRRS